MTARPRRTRAGLAGGLLAATIALAACSTAGDLPDAGEILGAMPTFEGAPAEVAGRAPVPFCGRESLSLPDGAPDPAARDCFWQAHEEARAAEFVSENSTMEGDPITWIYRSLEGGGAIVYVDSTKDRWSAMTWLRIECPELVIDPGAAGAPAFGPPFVTTEACAETTLE